MIDSFETLLQSNLKKRSRPRTYWKIYNDGHGMKMELTHIPRACVVPVQRLRDVYTTTDQKERAVELLTPLACELLGMEWYDFARLPERQRLEAMLSAAYNLGNVDPDGLGKLCSLLGLDNWEAPQRDIRSLKLTKKKFVDYALNNPFDWFVTLTVAPCEGRDRLLLSDVKKAVAVAVKTFNRKYSCKLSYIFIPEQHEKGGWHLHGLVGGIPAEALTAFQRSRHNPRYITLKLAKDEPVFKCQYFEDKLGWNTFEPIENKEAVTRYCTKYITKELLSAKVSKSTRLLVASQGLDKPAHGECPERLQKFLDEWFDSRPPDFTASRNWKLIQATTDVKEKEALLSDKASISYSKYSLVGAEVDSFFSFCASHGITISDFLQTPRLQDP